MFATISSSGRIRRSISTRGRAITNDWRISMARAIVGNRATSGGDQRPMYDQLLRSTTDRTINRDGRRPMVRSIVASCNRSCEQSWHPACDRSYEHSWHPVTERTTSRGTRRPINRGVQRSIARSIVASCDRSLQPTTDRTINRALPIRDHPQLVVPLCTTGGTIT